MNCQKTFSASNLQPLDLAKKLLITYAVSQLKSSCSNQDLKRSALLHVSPLEKLGQVDVDKIRQLILFARRP